MRGRRTYLYKLTSDRGGAPCAPEPSAHADPLLTLAICKPAIRRTAQPGDRLVGITSHSLAQSDGYPLLSVIYAAIIQEGIDAADYFAPENTARPDCIYEFHQQNGRASHRGHTQLHADARHVLKDLGQYPFYRNGRVLMASDFRYFGARAVRIPLRLGLLIAATETLGQGHRVYASESPEAPELDALFKLLWKRPMHFTPKLVEGDAYDHTPRKHAASDVTSARRSRSKPARNC